MRFFLGGSSRTGYHLFSMVSFFANINTCSNRSGVGAIDNPDQSEQVFDKYNIAEAPANFFKDEISMVCRQNMFIFGV